MTEKIQILVCIFQKHSFFFFYKGLKLTVDTVDAQEYVHLYYDIIICMSLKVVSSQKRHPQQHKNGLKNWNELLFLERDENELRDYR